MAKQARNFDATLRNWTAVTYPQGVVIYGTIYDDHKKRFGDGEKVRTSLIVQLNREEGFAKTLNTLYKLENELD